MFIYPKKIESITHKIIRLPKSRLDKAKEWLFDLKQGLKDFFSSAPLWQWVIGSIVQVRHERKALSAFGSPHLLPWIEGNGSARHRWTAPSPLPRAGLPVRGFLMARPTNQPGTKGHHLQVS